MGPDMACKGLRSRFQRGEMFDKISGSPQYMAPELVGQRYDYRVDMRPGLSETAGR